MILVESLHNHNMYYIYFSQFHNSEFPFKMTLETQKGRKKHRKIERKINKSNWYFTQGYAP